MDLYVERQCIDEMKKGNLKQIMMLYDACFVDMYSYVARRVDDGVEAERVVRLTFLDALGQVQNTPADISYTVWLYSLAKPRVWSYINKTSFPEKQGLISLKTDSDKTAGFKEEVLRKAEKMFGKLSIEEREILRLKFFENLTDGDVMAVLGEEEKAIGTKIYRVLKRAHFLLFGESDENQGVYFGELSSFLQRIKDLEEIAVPEAFKLSLRADLSKKLDQRESAVDAKVGEEDWGPKEMIWDQAKKNAEEDMAKPGSQPPAEPEQEDFQTPADVPWAKEGPEEHLGSDDPAKIFVQAVKDMTPEEMAEIERDQEKMAKKERMYEFLERRKFTLALIPAALFVAVVSYVVMGLVSLEEEPEETACEDVVIGFEGEIEEDLKKDFVKEVAVKICDNYKIDDMGLAVLESGQYELKVDAGDLNMEYVFEQVDDKWKLKSYEKASDSDTEPRKVRRDR